jgi:hypothetical protein
VDALSQRALALLTAALWVVAACTVAWCVARGASGADRRLDARALVLAGQAWLQRESPYDAEAYSRLWEQELQSPRPDAFVFAYPPSTALVLAPLALPGVAAGLGLLDALNLIALAFALVLCARLGGDPAPREWRGAARAAALALAASCGAISGTLLIGQTSLWALAALLWLWRSSAADELRTSTVLAIAVVAMKPSLTLPLLCFLAVLRPWTVAWAAALSLAVCAIVAAATSDAALPIEWLRAVAAYAATPANAPAELASAQHLMARLGPAVPGWPLVLAGALAAAAVGWSARGMRERDALDEHWIAAVALSLACSPAHGYDLVLAAPLAALLLRVRPGAWPWYGLGVLAVARPSALGRAAAVLGGGDPLELERWASALGVALLAIGACSGLVLGIRYLRPFSLLTHARVA